MRKPALLERTITEPKEQTMNAELNRVVEEIERYASEQRRAVTLSLEAGRGETYANSAPTLYVLGRYKRSSVLAGREQRVFSHQWEGDEWDKARAELAEIASALRKLGCRIRVEDSGASSYVPIEQIVRHLPDDTDY